MIYTTKKWHTEHGYEYSHSSFKDGPLRYVANASSLNADQLEHILRIEGGFPRQFVNRGSAQGFATTTFGSSTIGTIFMTGPEFAVYQNVMWLGLGGILAAIAGTFGYYGVKNAQKAVKEARAKRATLPPGAKLFPITGMHWDMLREALEKIDADETAKAKALEASKLVKQLPATVRKTPERFKSAKALVGKGVEKVRHEIELLRMPEEEYQRYQRLNSHGNVTELEPAEPQYAPDAEIVQWQIMMYALKEHTHLGRMLDTYISDYLVRTEGVVLHLVSRADISERKREELKATLRHEAYVEMLNMYPLLDEMRMVEDFERGRRLNQYQYETERTRIEADASADAAIMAARSYSSSLQPQLH